MSGKPVVALALSKSLHEIMFMSEDLSRLGELAEVVGPVQEPKSEAIQPLLREATAAITCWGSPRFDAALLDGAPKLKLIAHSAGSIRPVVTDAVYERGIQITTAAAANAEPVAETTVAMMVIMLKRIPWVFPQRAERRALLQPVKPIRELRDLEIGIIGASRVGREVIRLLQSYPRLRIKVYDPYLTEMEARNLRVERASLEDVCRCEVVSVHAPSLESTRHMLNARTLALLPDHAVLLNTSRGSLIDETALVAEVRRRPLYVYLDVTEPEPPAVDSPLLKEPNILLTPHIAGAMNQARKDMGRLAIDETLRFLRGEPLSQAVTRQMLPSQA
ncbi:MAG TPA: hydroxyacid dehydrogenase [Tepidisphaeraceae bacterium]